MENFTVRDDQRSWREVSHDQVSAKSTLDGLRVLIIEDEPLIAMALAVILEECGVERMDFAVDLESAIDTAHSTRANLAIIDINLAGRDSFPAASVLQKRGIPFFFVTGYTKRPIPPDLLAALVVDKPYTQSMLLHGATATLRSRRR